MKSAAELDAIREKLNLYKGYSCPMSADDVKVVVGMGTCGIAAGAREVVKAFMDEVEKRGLVGVKVTQSGCIGKCDLEPVVEVTLPGKEKVTYIKVDPDKAREIVASHIVGGKPVQNYMNK